MSKRSISSILDEDEEKSLQLPQRKARLESYHISYPNFASPVNPPPFQKPSPLISFSYTPEHVLQFTDSARRYYVEPPLGAKLDYGYDRWIRRPEERGRLDGLLKALSRAVQKGKAPADISVVAWRGVMTKILTAPYEERDGWELNVMYVNGTMYFEEHLSEAKLKEKNDIEPRHRIQMYYGYAFESYSTSETPTRPLPDSRTKDPPAWGGDVDTNVQWCSVVRTKLGDMRMVIGGEVDCVRSASSSSTDAFVELKTSLKIRGSHDEAKFEKKLLKFYFQSFLLGVPEIVVGFRTPSGQVTTVQSFKTMQIPRMVRGKPNAWNPSVCLEWGQRFLTFLKQTVTRGNGGDPPTESDAGTVWRVVFTPKGGANVMRLGDAEVTDVIAGEDRVGFLPRFYWDELAATPVSPVVIQNPMPSLGSTTNSVSVAGWTV